jgi:hypothetical protein
MAFRFYRRNDIVLYTAAQVYEGDLVEPERWHHLSPGTHVFLRLPGGLETAPIVGALILANQLSQDPATSACCLDLDLHPDRPLGQEPAEGEVVCWHRSQVKTLFVYWERAKAGPKRDTPC